MVLYHTVNLSCMREQSPDDWSKSAVEYMFCAVSQRIPGFTKLCPICKR